MSKTTTTAEETAHEEIELTRYELMVLINPNANSVEYQKQVDTIKKLLADHGADCWHEEEWGKRELAYTIKKQDYAYYLIVNFDMNPAEMPAMEAQLRIMNFVLRHLVLKVPANYTPQTYNLEEEEKKPQKEEAKKPVPVKKTTPVKETTPVEEAKPVPVEVEEGDVVATEEAETIEEEAPKKKPSKISKEEAEADLSKLDAKLEELLSGDDDLNL